MTASTNRDEMSSSSCSSASSCTDTASLASVATSTKVQGLSDDLVTYLMNRGSLNESVSRPKVSKKQQLHQGSHAKQLILEKKQKGAIIRSVENPIGNARRDPQSFDADTALRDKAFQDAFNAMEKVKEHHLAETSVQGNPTDGIDVTTLRMQQKKRDAMDPRMAAAGHIPPLWWGDGLN